jgi:hypothetical protein
MASPKEGPESTGTSVPSSDTPSGQPSTQPTPAGSRRLPSSREEFLALSPEEQDWALAEAKRRSAEAKRRADEATASRMAGDEAYLKSIPPRPRKLRDWEY